MSTITEMNRFQGVIHWIKNHFILVIFIIALLVRLSFCLILFPRLEGPLHLGTDPDQFGQLAKNWVDKGFLSFDGIQPTTFRGPGILYY
jgi:hypothetical protein